MELIFRICLFITGVINFLPSILAFIPVKISTSYGVDISNSNLELLLRHRAVLFGIIGGIMIHSAITKKNYSLSIAIGLISMISFLILYQLQTGEINPQLSKVMKADVVGIIILVIGAMLFKIKKL